MTRGLGGERGRVAVLEHTGEKFSTNFTDFPCYKNPLFGRDDLIFKKCSPKIIGNLRICQNF